MAGGRIEKELSKARRNLVYRCEKNDCILQEAPGDVLVIHHNKQTSFHSACRLLSSPVHLNRKRSLSASNTEADADENLSFPKHFTLASRANTFNTLSSTTARFLLVRSCARRCRSSNDIFGNTRAAQVSGGDALAVAAHISRNDTGDVCGTAFDIDCNFRRRNESDRAASLTWRSKRFAPRVLRQIFQTTQNRNTPNSGG